jgi:hypothetical protein
VAIRCMPATNPAYPLGSYLLARSGRKSTGKTKRKLLRPRHQIARFNVRYVWSRPARRTGIAKGYHPAKTGQLPSKPDRLWAVFYLAASPTLPPRKSSALRRRQPETTSDSDAGRRFHRTDFFKIRHDAGGHFRVGIMDPERDRLRTKYLCKINCLMWRPRPELNRSTRFCSSLDAIPTNHP